VARTILKQKTKKEGEMIKSKTRNTDLKGLRKGEQLNYFLVAGGPGTSSLEKSKGAWAIPRTSSRPRSQAVLRVISVSSRSGWGKGST